MEKLHENKLEFYIENTKIFYEKYTEISTLLTYPEVIADKNLAKYYNKEISSIQQQALLYSNLIEITKEITQYQEILNQFSQNEQEDILKEISKLNEKANLLIEKFENSNSKNSSNESCIIEINNLEKNKDYLDFHNKIVNMFLSLCQNLNLKINNNSIYEDLRFENINSTLLYVFGVDAYEKLKIESGLHKSVNGNKSSTIQVLIYPYSISKNNGLDEKDLKIETFRSSGAGGQHINKTDSAVKITHLPTNINVTCQTSRSQFQNKEKALELLKLKIQQKQQEEEIKKIALVKKENLQNSTLQKVYNFDENLVSSNLNSLSYNLNLILSGDLSFITTNDTINTKEKFKNSSLKV